MDLGPNGLFGSLPGAGGGGRGWLEGACVPRGTSGNTPSLIWVWVFALGVGLWSLGNAGVANPYSPLGCALLWAYVGGKIRACGGCSVGAFCLSFSLGVWFWFGREYTGPPSSTLEGRLGPSGLSPEASGWVTSDVAPGHRASESL